MIKVDGDRIMVKTPYDELFIQEMKKMFPEARFDRNEKAWIIPYSIENLQFAEKIVDDFFNVKEEKLCIALAGGRAPRVNDMLVVRYSRDDYALQKAWNFHAIEAVRMIPHGSRTHPEFHGVVVFKFAMTNKTKVAASKLEVFPYSKALHEIALKMLKESSEDTPEKLYQKIVDELREVAKTIEVKKENSVEDIEKLIEEKKKMIEKLQKEIEELQAKMVTMKINAMQDSLTASLQET
ncbi:MAG: hypothetical protein NZ894_05875 [Archaeoglobaceae archaeon]|nr:hypothetical protein [Archaeoglobaceae archaeon]